MKIRRYLGHDADSVNGFNNGYHIDEYEGIEVKDHAEASALCLEALNENYTVDSRELVRDDDGYTLTTCYSDDDGNKITREAYELLNESDDDVGGYRYVFVNYHVVDGEE